MAVATSKSSLHHNSDTELGVSRRKRTTTSVQSSATTANAPEWLRNLEWSADLEQKQLDAAKRLSELEKAQLDALTPKDLLAVKVYEEKQTALRRTTVERQKAVDLLASRRTAVAAERRNLQLRIEKASTRAS